MIQLLRTIRTITSADWNLANGFSELTDANEQRQRFEEALKLRSAKNWARYFMPEKFLQALQTMPEAAGIALGIDRLLMILANACQIDDVIALLQRCSNSTTFNYLSH